LTLVRAEGTQRLHSFSTIGDERLRIGVANCSRF
jgi:hypothetical protein